MTEEAATPLPAPPPPPLPENPSRSALRRAIREGRVAEVLSALQRLSPVRRAEIFVQFRIPEQKALLAAAPPELAASILADCDSASLALLLRETDLDALAPVLRLIPPDNLADILLHLPPGAVEKALHRIDPPLREEVRKLMTFDPESAGGLMTPRYLSVPDVVTIGRALELLRAEKAADTPSYIYIVDANGKLAGVAPLRGLILGNPRNPISSIMIRDVVRLRVTAPREEIVRLFHEHHYVSLPVVDDKDRLAGIVTADDAMSAMREAGDQVVRSLTGADPREALKETWTATRGRIPWITVSIVGGLGCAAIAGIFRRTLEEIVVLGLFVPIVLALGESIGAQTTSVVLSALAGGTVSRSELAGFAMKEIFVGLLMGLYSGIAVALSSFLWHGNPRLGALIGGAVFLSVAWAAILAVFIPSAMRRMNVNPAIASGPLVLALADFSTLGVYLGGATLFRHALH